MKIAVLSDIHGNLPALLAVAEHVAAWQPDQVVVNGDTVNRGPSSLAAWRFVAAQPDWYLLKGNHEDYVVGHHETSAVQNGRLFEINYISYWTYLQVQPEIDTVGQLADGLSFFAPDNSELRFRHASMKHNRDGIWHAASQELVQRQIGNPPALFATAHIHRPFARRVNETLVVNSGSVGTPADEDTRASYAQIVWRRGQWQAKIIRLPYDRSCAQRDYAASGYFSQAGPVGWLVFHEWQQAKGILYPWLKLYYDSVMAGEIELETAVIDYLSHLGLPWPGA